MFERRFLPNSKRARKKRQRRRLLVSFAAADWLGHPALLWGIAISGLLWWHVFDDHCVRQASITALQLYNLLAFVAFLLIVCVPGRWDDPHRRQGESMQSNNHTTNSLWNPHSRWSTSWMLVIVCDAVWICRQQQVESLPRTTAYIVGAQLYQMLWCIWFRPPYGPWGAVGCNVLSAYGWGRALPYATASLKLACALHFGQSVVSSVIGINGLVIHEGVAQSLLSVVSTIILTLGGCHATMLQQSKALGLMVAFGLHCCAQTLQHSPGRKPLYSKQLEDAQALQCLLLQTGCYLCVGASAVVVFWSSSLAAK